jgi:hypothetical protein
MSVVLSVENHLYVRVAINSCDTVHNAAVLQLCGEWYLKQHTNTTQIKLKVYSTNTLF